MRFRRRTKLLRFLLATDELSESNRIIKFLGLTFVILSFLYILDFVKLSEIIITSISLSGIFFIVGDILEHRCKVILQKKAININIRYDRIGYFKILKSGCQFLAMISLIVAPYLILSLSDSMITKVSGTLSMLAIGLTVFKIGLDNSMKKFEFEGMIADEFYKAMTEKPNPLQEEKN